MDAIQINRGDQMIPILEARAIASLSPDKVIYAFLVPNGLSRGVSGEKEWGLRN